MDGHKVKLCSRWCSAMKILFLWAHSWIWQKNTAKTFAGVAVPDYSLFKQKQLSSARSTSQFTDQGESPADAPLSLILCPAQQPCKVQGRARGLPPLWSRMTSPGCVCTAPTTSAVTPNQTHRRYWPRTKPGMLETIKQQMQQKWIHLHLNKSKSQWEVKDNKLWRQLKGEMVHFHCIIVDLRNDSKPSEM